MRVVLFAGGRGLRMRDGAADVPKPLCVLGGRPLLWHLMSWYAAHGHVDFVLCLGYRAQEVRETLSRHAEPDWRITYADTGLDTPIGQRLVRVRDAVQDDEMFLANYADVLTDVPVADMVETFRSSGASAALLAVRPQDSFHVVDIGAGSRVRSVRPVTAAPLWQNGGFFVMRPDVFDAIQDGEDLVDQPFGRLAARGRLLAYPWEGFWAPLDTQKDRQRLQDMYARGYRPWTVPTQLRRARGAA